MSPRAAASRQYVMTLDVGSSSVRAIFHDLEGHVVRGLEVQRRYVPRIQHDGTAEVDADRLAWLCARCLADLLRLGGPRRAGGIAAVGVSTFWHGLMAVDESARAFTPLYLWSDSRSWKAAEHLGDRMDAEVIRSAPGARSIPATGRPSWNGCVLSGPTCGNVR